MGILEIIAEARLGRLVLAQHSALKSRLRATEKAMGSRPASRTSDEDKERIAAIVELCFEYDRERDSDERKNILRTLEEIVMNEPVDLPRETLDQWDDRLAGEARSYAVLRRREKRRTQVFLKKYFSFRAKAGLRTQADVAKKAGLARTHVTALELGGHAPQQQTLQKLAKAFGVDVTDLM
jgi:DNA-binding XRE family transcriptional regulator